MELRELTDSLKKTNRHSGELKHALETLAESNKILLARKGRDLVEVVKNYLEKENPFPLVDKRLSVVFGTEWGSHKFLRVELYRYHYAARNPSAAYIEPHKAEDAWLLENMGYYFASTPSMSEVFLGIPPRRIIAAQTYRPDRFDKELFEFYEVNYTL